jgi:hypothetical protein
LPESFGAHDLVSLEELIHSELSTAALARVDRSTLVLSFPLITRCIAVRDPTWLLLFSRARETQMLFPDPFCGTLFGREVSFPKLINLLYFGL